MPENTGSVVCVTDVERRQCSVSYRCRTQAVWCVTDVEHRQCGVLQM